MNSGRGSWLVSPTFDLLAFGLPAFLSLALLALEERLAPSGELPVPMWVLGVLAVDVAHVWSTLHVTYLDPGARRRFGAWLLWTPPLAFVGAGLLAQLGLGMFWRCLAYLAVFHFVRQQYGWMKLYQRRQAEFMRFERGFDTFIIYLATLYPLLWWHVHLPRGFAWFSQGDFIDLSSFAWVVDAFFGFYLTLLCTYGLIQMLRTSEKPWGKLLLVSSTAACWGFGILGTHSDWGFTVTNVFIHGVPYLAYVSHIRHQRGGGRSGWAWAWLYGLPLGLAYLEEWGWDRALWHEGGLFFGPKLVLSAAAAAWITAALAMPQLTHYILDGVIWRAKRLGNPEAAISIAARS